MEKPTLELTIPAYSIGTELNGNDTYSVSVLESQIASLEFNGGGEGIVWIQDTQKVNLSGSSDPSCYDSSHISEPCPETASLYTSVNTDPYNNL